MLRRILSLLLLLSLFVGVASAYEEHVFIQADETGGSDGDPGAGDTTPAKGSLYVVIDLELGIVNVIWLDSRLLNLEVNQQVSRNNVPRSSQSKRIAK